MDRQGTISTDANSLPLDSSSRIKETTGFCAQPRASYDRQIGGCKWDQGRAASKAAAPLSTVASENRWPTICRPMGSPSLEKPAGTLHDGRCARLKL